VHFADAVIEFRIQGGNPIVSQPHAQDISINEKLPLQTPPPSPPPQKKKRKKRKRERGGNIFHQDLQRLVQIVRQTFHDKQKMNR
jgi:ribosomal protein S6E (S10)